MFAQQRFVLLALLSLGVLVCAEKTAPTITTEEQQEREKIKSIRAKDGVWFWVGGTMESNLNMQLAMAKRTKAFQALDLAVQVGDAAKASGLILELENLQGQIDLACKIGRERASNVAFYADRALESPEGSSAGHINKEERDSAIATADYFQARAADRGLSAPEKTTFFKAIRLIGANANDHQYTALVAGH
jgi:hypothetical protein